jgi:hypothetical protein
MVLVAIGFIIFACIISKGARKNFAILFGIILLVAIIVLFAMCSTL